MSHKATKESEILDLSGLEKEKVYISGPVTSSGWVIHHLRNAIDMAEKVANAGFVPFIPHTAVLWDMIYPGHDYDFWLYTVTLPWVSSCDYLLRLPGESLGADKEVEVAKILNIPVVYHFDKLLELQRRKLYNG